MTMSVLRVGVSVCVLAATGVSHAATPMTLPFGDLPLQGSSTIALPLPPPPPVAVQDVTRMRLVIKSRRGGCPDGRLETRRTGGERRQEPTPAAAPGVAVSPARLG